MLLTWCLEKFLFDAKCNTFSYGCVPMQIYLTLRLSLLLTLQCILGSRSVQKCAFMCCSCHYFPFIEALNFNKSTQVYIQLYINIHFAFASFTKRFRSEMPELTPPSSLIDSFQESCKNQDDEHCLIARYASRLAADGAAPVREPIRMLFRPLANNH